jgi:S1-C subfamily serine protease
MITFVKMSSQIVVAIAALNLASAAIADNRVIYGQDDRRDLFESSNSARHLELARSTAIIMHNANLTRSGSTDQYSVPSDTFGSQQDLCASEPFFEQPAPGFCSGFLVGEDLFVTAGHCITDAESCADAAFVFGYGYESQGQDMGTVSGDDVFHCKSIVARVQNPGLAEDFAVVKLDRAVVGREPLKLRRTGAISVGDGVTVIGHPSGLPTKITSGAKVRSNGTGLPYFVANTDSYGGNSGSAVFNTTTGEVEGILVRGETDFVLSGNCVVSKKCTESNCRGEDVTKASVFASHVPAL